MTLLDQLGPRQIGDILAGKSFTKSRHTGQPVWRNSYYKGTIEDRLWKPIADGKVRGGKRFAGAVLKAARAFELRTRVERRKKEKGSQNGAIGAIGLEVLEALFELVDFATGQLDPAISTIAEKIQRSYSAVHEALCRLRQAGFLQWARRSQPVEDPDPFGPQVEQTSNAYALLVPKALENLVARLWKRGPVPACEQSRRAMQQEEFERMIADLTAGEYQDQFWQGDRLAGETLRRIAALVDARESSERKSGSYGETGGVVPTP